MIWFFSTILVPIFVIGILIFVHELGHFILAKISKVGVISFSIGFGPKLFSFRRKETTYQICAIPLGGYVRMVGDMPDSLTGEQPTDATVRGDEGEELQQDLANELPEEVKAVLADRSRWFINKGFAPRFAIVLAGPLFNFIFAILVITGSAFFYGEEIPAQEAILGAVMEDSPAQKAGLLPGDQVLSVDGVAVSDWEGFSLNIKEGGSTERNLLVRRGLETLVVNVSPGVKEILDHEGKVQEIALIGVERLLYHKDVGLWRSFYFGMEWTLNLTARTYEGLWGMLTGQVSAKDLAGPIFIFDAAGKQAKKGLENVLVFMALLSVSLAVLNLLPIPVLDGGHLMFFLLELIFGPIGIRKKEIAQQIGMVFLLGLTIVAVVNDITRKQPFEQKEITWNEDKNTVSETETTAVPAGSSDISP